MNRYILIIEDDPETASTIVLHLAREANRVRTVADAAEAYRALELEPPDLVVLAWRLRERSGQEILEELRRRPDWLAVPVLVLGGRAGRDDGVESLGLGASDYLRQPFSPRELVLRVGVVLRTARNDPGYAAGSLRIMPEAARVTIAGVPVSLTPVEYRLLVILTKHQGQVVSREKLAQAVPATPLRQDSRSVDTHMLRLRRKLGDAAGWIETVRGFGYRFREEGHVREWQRQA